MDNNANPNTGAKGVFPGLNANQTTPPTQMLNTTNQPVEDFSEAKTFLNLETKNIEGQISGIIEIDLISFRERGQESRYLSIKTVGAGEGGKSSETAISISNEDDFNRFKKFISELNWND